MGLPLGIIIIGISGFFGWLLETKYKVKEPVIFWLLGGLSILAAATAILCYNSWV